MAISYLLGNLAGRAVVSYLLVWFICWLSGRFDWRTALRRSVRWYSILAVLILTVLGLAASMTTAGGIGA